MAVAQYKEAMEHASKIIKQAKRRYYTFLIGKINCAKLNNFMEVDMYVLIACNENSLIDSKDFNKPCITLYELEIAFNCARTWGNEFICDYNDLLPGKSQHIMNTSKYE
jgi:diphthamide biosynthesis protein 2